MKDVVIKSKDDMIEQLRERIAEMKVMSMVVPEANLIEQPIDKPSEVDEKEREKNKFLPKPEPLKGG